MSELAIGETVYLKSVGNNARYDKEVRIVEFVVKKVGRKYFEVGEPDDNNPRHFIKFNVEDMCQTTIYAADWQLYLSKQEILDEEEARKLTREIRDVFDRYGKVDLTLEQLRKIKAIIG